MPSFEHTLKLPCGNLDYLDITVDLTGDVYSCRQLDLISAAKKTKAVGDKNEQNSVHTIIDVESGDIECHQTRLNHLMDLLHTMHCILNHLSPNNIVAYIVITKLAFPRPTIGCLGTSHNIRYLIKSYISYICAYYRSLGSVKRRITKRRRIFCGPPPVNRMSILLSRRFFCDCGESSVHFPFWDTRFCVRAASLSSVSRGTEKKHVK